MLPSLALALLFCLYIRVDILGLLVSGYPATPSFSSSGPTLSAVPNEEAPIVLIKARWVASIRCSRSRRPDVLTDTPFPEMSTPLDLRLWNVLSKLDTFVIQVVAHQGGRCWECGEKWVIEFHRVVWMIVVGVHRILLASPRGIDEWTKRALFFGIVHCFWGLFHPYHNPEYHTNESTCDLRDDPAAELSERACFPHHCL